MIWIKRIRGLLAGLFFSFLSLALVFLTAEISATAVYWILDKKYISVADKLSEDHEAYLDAQNLRAGWARRGTYKQPRFPHPYLGYTLHSIPPDAADVNSAGFHGGDFPLSRTPGVFQLMISGGSVAEQLGLHGALQSLEDELNRRYTNEKIKKFVVLNGAMGGWHQPQQQIMLMLWAQAIDGFVTLEGWNERRYMWDWKLHRRMEMPDELYYMAVSTHFGRSLRYVAYRLDAKVKDWQRDSFLGSHSKFVFFITQRLRNSFRSWAVGEVIHVPNGARDFSINQFALPEAWDKQQVFDFNVESYKKYLRTMHAIAGSEGVRDLFLIQSSAVYGKRLSPEESKLKSPAAERERYRKMTGQLTALHEQNIPVFDLLDAFQGVDEKIYNDRIHVNTKGSMILKDRILDMIVREWGLKAKT